MAYEIPSEGAKRCMIYQHDPNPVEDKSGKEGQPEASTKSTETARFTVAN